MNIFELFGKSEQLREYPRAGRKCIGCELMILTKGRQNLEPTHSIECPHSDFFKNFPILERSDD